MRRLIVLLVAFLAILYLGIASAVAQHGRGMSGGKGLGMPGTPSEERGHLGRPTGQSEKEPSKVEANKNSSSTAGKKTVSELLTQDTKLSSKLQGLLPSGTKLQDAAKGFDHLGQFVAAVHVSHNLGIPFDQLKAKITGPSAVSLGEAIHQLKPNVNAKQEAIKANEQALQDMEKSMASSKSASAGSSSTSTGRGK